MATLSAQPVSLHQQAVTSGSPACQDDLPTLGAISTIAFILSDGLHQAAHAWVGMRTVSPFSMLTSAGWSSAYDNALTDLAGPFVNLLAAALLWLLLRLFETASVQMRLFLLLACAFNLLQATGLLFLSGATGLGDWSSVLGASHQLIAWLPALALAGALAWRASLSFIGFGFTRYLGLVPADRSRIFRFALYGYVSVLLVSLLAALMNRIGLKFLALSELAPTLLADAGLFWVRRFMPHSVVPARASEPLSRSWPWICVSSVIALAFIFILGRGIILTR